MSRAAKRQSKRELFKVASRDGKTQASYLKMVDNNHLSELEYQIHKCKFLDFKPRNQNQSLYLKSIKSNRLTFATGPSGVGKSICATVSACEALEAQEIERIIITRPMVGCDEEIGFLPGTEEEKYIGWVGPVLEILEQRLGKKKVKNYIDIGKIVLKPLMMMRGSTFRDAFVILDEAQNTTASQMKMFLTRIGEGSKIVINGDIEQSDLKPGVLNGLSDSLQRLSYSKIISVVEFTEADIVRDPLVREIVKAYRN